MKIEIVILILDPEQTIPGSLKHEIPFPALVFQVKLSKIMYVGQTKLS